MAFKFDGDGDGEFGPILEDVSLLAGPMTVCGWKKEGEKWRAECAAWRRALTAEEIQRFLAGEPACSIAPEDLVMYSSQMPAIVSPKDAPCSGE